MKNNLILLTLVLILNSCTDSTKELGDGYWLRIEGKGSNQIFNHDNQKKGIPADVINYFSNDEVIMVKQRPKKNADNMLDADSVHYGNGRENFYYWIIFKKNGNRVGPLSESDFKKTVDKNNMAINIEWQSIY
jgi:hypothetical protein